MKFWLKTTNIIYKNWLNPHIDSIMFTVSKLEILNLTIKVTNPVYLIICDNEQFVFYFYFVQPKFQLEVGVYIQM